MIYQIYILQDPRISEICYIGFTTRRTLRLRLKGHLANMNRVQLRSPLNCWLRWLRLDNQRPTIALLEMAFGTRVLAERLETKWIQYYEKRGYLVLNANKRLRPIRRLRRQNAEISDLCAPKPPWWLKTIY